MFFQRKTSKLIIITLVVFFLLIFLHYLRILSPVENLVIKITRPVLDTTYYFSNSIGNRYLEYKSKQDLSEENEELKSKVTDLIKEKSAYLEDREENEFLRDQLEFVNNNDYDYEVANVISKKIDNFQNILIIDKGERDGLKSGQPVLTSSGLLVGKISKVSKENSFVLLLNDDLSKVASKIQNKDKTMGLVEGEYGLGMKMQLIPQTEAVIPSDIVVTSGLEENVPVGLIIGEVETVSDEPEELFKSASIKTYVDFNKITLVNIIKGIKND